MKFKIGSPKALAWLVALLLPGLGGALAQSGPYDPLAIGEAPPILGVDQPVHDASRNRDIPTRVFLPSGNGPAPVILLSPGLGGTYVNYSYLSQHWAARGYAVVSIQHPGSDDSVWKDKPRLAAIQSMRAAVSPQNYFLRAKDVRVVLDQLERWNKHPGELVFGRLDLKKVGMTGHSFGAVTTEAVSGESIGALGPTLTDRRIGAAITMSPSIPRRADPEQAFSSVTLPWMVMTGTMDNSPIGDIDAASRLVVYPHLHDVPKYELVLDKAEHSAFSDRPLPGEVEPRNPNHHRVILALSTAFWDTYLRHDPQAAAWLAGPGARSVMQAGDKWQFDLAAAKH